MKTFKSILQFQKHFDTDEKCREYLELQRWNGTPTCPFCNSTNVHRFPNGRTFKCRTKECRKKFSVTVGTIYENTKISLTKWFLATYILSVHSKGISSLQLATWLDVTQKTAWFLNHRIREMLTEKAPKLLEGIVEVDETYVGGKETNKHKNKKADNGIGYKAPVIGAIQRGGTLTTKTIDSPTKENLVGFMVDNIKDNTLVITDEHVGYSKLSVKGFLHETVKHSAGEYVRGNVHTNTIEGFWSLLKRQINGIHHSISPKHLHRYCNENAFRYNNRGVTQDVRFADSLANCNGRLTYKRLIGKR